MDNKGAGDLFSAPLITIRGACYEQKIKTETFTSEPKRDFT